MTNFFPNFYCYWIFYYFCAFTARGGIKKQPVLAHAPGHRQSLPLPLECTGTDAMAYPGRC